MQRKVGIFTHFPLHIIILGEGITLRENTPVLSVPKKMLNFVA